MGKPTLVKPTAISAALLGIMATTSITLADSPDAIGLITRRLVPLPLARTVDRPPGTAVGVTFKSFEASPVINASGEVAFLSFLLGPNVDDANNRAIYEGGRGTLKNVVRSGDFIDTSGRYASILQGLTALNDAGEVGYAAGVYDSTSVYNANFAGPAGAIRVLALTRDHPPGTQSGVIHVTPDRPSLSRAGQAAFYTLLGGTGVTNLNNVAIYAGAFDAPSLVARTGDPAPGLDGLTLSTLPEINAVPPRILGGQVAFNATVAGPSVTDVTDGVIYAGAPGDLRVVAREGQPAAGLVGVNMELITFSMPVLNDAGNVAFSAVLRDVSNNGLSTGFFLSTPAGTRKIVTTGEAAPGFGAAAKLTTIGALALHRNSTVAFSGTVFGGSVTSPTNAVFAGPVDGLKPIIQDGPLALAEDPAVQSVVVRGFISNAAGQCVISVQLAGGGVNSNNNLALLAYDPNAGLSVIVRTGTSFDFGGVLKTVAANGFTIGNGSMESSLVSLNDNGQFAFVARFTDGSSGIYSVTVPEPSLAAAGLLFGTLAPRSRRRKL